MRRRGFRGTSGAAALAICLSVVATTTPAIAQDDEEAIDLSLVPEEYKGGAFKIDDGSYQGSLSYSSHMTMSSLHGQFGGSGNVSFEVTDGTMTGQWESAEIVRMVVAGFPAEGDGTGSGSGELSGSFPYVMSGSLDTTATATVMGQTGSGTGGVSISYELADSVQVCGQVHLNWNSSYLAYYQSLGWSPSVTSQMVVFPEVEFDELQQQLVSLTQEATFAAANITDPHAALVFMASVMLDAEALLSAIDSYPQACPPGPEFLRIINQVLRDMMNTLLDHWETLDQDLSMSLLRRLVEVGLRGGAIGIGAADQTAAIFLEDKIVALLQNRFDADPEVEEIRQTVVIASMLGYELSPNVSNEDICIALGGC